MSESQISDGNAGSVPSVNQQISYILQFFLKGHSAAGDGRVLAAESWRNRFGPASKESAREHENLRARQWHKLRPGRKQLLRP